MVTPADKPPTSQHMGEVNEIPEITPKLMAITAHRAKINRARTPPMATPKITKPITNLSFLNNLPFFLVLFSQKFDKEVLSC